MEAVLDAVADAERLEEVALALREAARLARRAAPRAARRAPVLVSRDAPRADRAGDPPRGAAEVQLRHRRADPRWAGFVASGSPATATLADTLPRDVVVCDWQYADPDPKRRRDDWPTLAHFLGKGFDVAGCPWLNFAAMEPMADFLAVHGGLGMIATTWHHLHCADWRNAFRAAACAAWGTPPRPVAPQFDTAFAVALRLAGLDAGVSSYRDTGLVEDQISLP